MAVHVEDAQYKPNKTSEYFKKLCKYVYLFGWDNYWVTEPVVSAIISKYHRGISIILNVITWIFIFAELSSFFTQHSLSEKQESDRNLFIISHPVLCSYGLLLSTYRIDFTRLLKTLTIDLKAKFNDEKVERDALRKALIYTSAFSCICIISFLSYGIDGLLQYIQNDATFITVITAWPDINDHSTLADVIQIINYIVWWLVIWRAFTIYVLLTTTIICLSQQFTQLQRYFYSLNDIFEKDGDIKEKEVTYEEAYKIGVEMHSRTLWCAQQCQRSCNAACSGHILVNITVITLLMSQMLNSERTLVNVVATVTTMCAMLISTGFVMWNAGDIAVEAAGLPTAMFHSGWHHCRGDASERVRKLLVISMAEAQKPVNIRSFGVISLSYDSYVSIVKLSYSVFSVLY